MRVFVILLLLFCAGTHAAPLDAAGTVEPIFTPGGDAEGAIVAALGGAQRNIRVQAYLLTSRNVAYALIGARRRGIAVEVLADSEMVKKGEYSLIPQLAANGIPVWLETRYAIAHNKVVIIDADGPEPIVITGSFNFTHSAQEHNAENLLVFRGNPKLTKSYLDNWLRHRDESVPFAAVMKK